MVNIWRDLEVVLNEQDKTGRYLVACKTMDGSYVFSGPPVHFSFIEKNQKHLEQAKFLGPLPNIS